MATVKAQAVTNIKLEKKNYQEPDVFKKPLIPIKIEKRITRKDNFKRPLNSNNCKKTCNRQGSFQRSSKYKTKELPKVNENLMKQLSTFFEIPSLLSPIKSRHVINPCSMKFCYKPRIIDDELKNMIDTFAMNIENLANGSSYEKLVLDNSEITEIIQEELREKKHRITEKMFPSKKRVKFTQG